MSDSIDESSAYNNFDEEYISTDTLEDIWYGNYVHPSINARYAILKLSYCISQAQSEWKVEELSANIMGKFCTMSLGSL